MKTKRILTLLIITVFMASLCAMMTGCGPGTEVSYPDGVETYTYTDDYGREVILRKGL